MICSHYKILKVSLLYIIVFSEQFPCSPVNNNNSFLLDFLHLNYVLIFENIWFVLINNMDYNQIFFITFLLRIYSIEVSAQFNYFSYLSGWFILIRMARVSLKLFFFWNQPLDWPPLFITCPLSYSHALWNVFGHRSDRLITWNGVENRQLQTKFLTVAPTLFKRNRRFSSENA